MHTFAKYVILKPKYFSLVSEIKNFAIEDDFKCSEFVFHKIPLNSKSDEKA